MVDFYAGRTDLLMQVVQAYTEQNPDTELSALVESTELVSAMRLDVRHRQSVKVVEKSFPVSIPGNIRDIVALRAVALAEGEVSEEDVLQAFKVEYPQFDFPKKEDVSNEIIYSS